MFMGFLQGCEANLPRRANGQGVERKRLGDVLGDVIHHAVDARPVFHRCLRAFHGSGILNWSAGAAP